MNSEQATLAIRRQARYYPVIIDGPQPGPN